MATQEKLENQYLPPVWCTWERLKSETGYRQTDTVRIAGSIYLQPYLVLKPIWGRPVRLWCSVKLSTLSWGSDTKLRFTFDFKTTRL